MPSWGKLLPSNSQEIFRRNLVFVCSYSALPKEVSNLLWNSWLSRNYQARGGGYISKTGFSRDGLGRGIFNPSVFSSTPDQAHQGRRTLKVKGETVLDHVVFWFGRADWQVKTRWSPFSLWDLAGKALLTPSRKEAEWQFKCFTQWKYQKYIGYQTLRRQKEKGK